MGSNPKRLITPTLTSRPAQQALDYMRGLRKHNNEVLVLRTFRVQGSGQI